MGCWNVRSKKIIGSPIFKPIETKLEKCGNKDIDEIFDVAVKSLQKSEDLRQKLASKFRNMIIETGVCVLRQPTIERCISSFLVIIFIEICTYLDGKYGKFKSINYSKLFQFHSASPFFSINKEILDELKLTLGFDFPQNSNVTKSKKAILEFIESLGLFKEWFLELSHEMEHLLKSSVEFMKKIKEKLLSNKEDGITFEQAKKFIEIGEKNLIKIGEVTRFIGIANSFIAQTASTVYSLAEKILRPQEIIKLQKIAIDAVGKKIYDPKEVVFTYTKEDKCKIISEWEQNICYRDDDEEEELVF